MRPDRVFACFAKDSLPGWQAGGFCSQVPGAQSATFVRDEIIHGNSMRVKVNFAGAAWPGKPLRWDDHAILQDLFCHLTAL